MPKVMFSILKYLSYKSQISHKVQYLAQDTGWIDHCEIRRKEKLQCPKKWFAKCDKHYPSRPGQTSLATAVANFTKPRKYRYFQTILTRARWKFLIDIKEVG